MENKSAFTTTYVRCSVCDSHIGTVIEVGRRAWLLVGGLRLYAAHGQCPCGAEFHWTAGDVALARLVERANKKRLPKPVNGL